MKLKQRQVQRRGEGGKTITRRERMTRRKIKIKIKRTSGERRGRRELKEQKRKKNTGRK